MAHRKPGPHNRPTWNQAAKVLAKFAGPDKTGASRLADMLGVSRVTITRWTWAKPTGTDGLIPSRSVARINRVARLQGVVLTERDWVPERVIYDEDPDEGFHVARIPT